MKSNIYNIDYNKLTAWLVPAYIRKPLLLAYLKVVVAGVSFLYQDFLRYRKARLYDLMITPQVCYLQLLLNGRYDFVQRRITIVDGIDKQPFYIYQDVELKPKYIRLTSEAAPRYIYTAGESGMLTDDFVIKVPAGIVFEPAEMRSLVKGYKLAGTRFKIQIV